MVTDKHGAFGVARRDDKLEVFSHTDQGLKVTPLELPHLTESNEHKVQDVALMKGTPYLVIVTTRLSDDAMLRLKQAIEAS